MMFTESINLAKDLLKKTRWERYVDRMETLGKVRNVLIGAQNQSTEFKIKLNALESEAIRLNFELESLANDDETPVWIKARLREISS